ncbi:ESX secretion-associated protein EspG [Nocardia flavorosea]|uniref:ESX secretion-associated protein EspG n=1 Tax=Nocardia flavorosea TaxID=53429 RepID=UPI002B4AADD1|nr:ESX secretion-associated protein EspG [Nocardia flavorosea]
MIAGDRYGPESETGPTSVDLNVDAALVLQNMVGIDSYPAVLAILPNIPDIAVRDKVHAVVTDQLTEAGIVEDGRVHPAIASWLHSLHRPDMELAVRVMDNGSAGHEPTMLRISLVRDGDSHVLAIRCDDHVVIQPVFHQGRRLNTHTAVVKSALGDYPLLQFEPVSAPVEELQAVPDDAEERRRVLCELGATPRAAGVITRAMAEVVRRAEIVMIEHRDGGSGSIHTRAGVNVLDTMTGRLIVNPRAAMDGQLWSTFQPGDDAAIEAGIDALIDLLPGRSWFDTSRTP